MASKIRDELIKTSKLEKKRGEDDAAFMVRVHFAIASAITDAEWNALSGPAQDWNNAAATTIDNKQDLPAFEDETDDAPSAAAAAPPARGRRGAGTPGVTPGLPEPFVPKVGAPVIVTTKRGKAVPGIIVELTDDEVVINPQGEAGEKEDDQDFVLSAVTITAAPPVLNAASAAAQAAAGTTGQDAEEGPMEPQVGDSVQVVTSRDKTIMGNVIELDMEADVLVLKDASGADHELVPSRLKSVEVKHRPAAGKGNAGGTMPANKLGVAPAAPAAKGRRGAAAAAPAAAAGAANDDEDGGKPTVASVIRDTLVSNPAATLEDSEKALKKAGVTYSTVTAKVAHAATQKTVQAVHKKHGIK